MLLLSLLIAIISSIFDLTYLSRNLRVSSLFDATQQRRKLSYSHTGQEASVESRETCRQRRGDFTTRQKRSRFVSVVFVYFNLINAVYNVALNFRSGKAARRAKEICQNWKTGLSCNEAA